ncbi:hypothetical protein CALVIDRAFT_534464 [Calocera viscosa TUFC12733]|uniref:Zinc-ribbon 15 domain-containing protein n=1 Tax=Calocera viscosa (strain TUFC12733) TaxID=1330018 RepID=A0A167Q6U5_CALVF|nr:hypothetical protein CALVIDRAFT_534464 [Calocera viscosa TUFC12733]
MCDFIPLCFVWGCPTKIEPDNSGPTMLCPRCHNASVHGAKSRMWFEFCFVPIIPCQSEQIYYCPICSWDAPQAGNPPPPLAQPGFNGPGQGQQYTQPGYQPAPNASQGWGGQGAYGSYGGQPYPPATQGQGAPTQGQGTGYQQGGYGQPYPQGH